MDRNQKMSDMSFKQAKQLVERMEFSEISIKKATNSLEKTIRTFDEASRNFDKTLRQQEGIMRKIPDTNKKMSYIYIVLAVNIGFVLGLVVAKYIFS